MLPALNLQTRSTTDPAGGVADRVARMYQEHAPRIWIYLHHRTGDRHTADDLLAEVFLAAVRRMGGWQDRGVPVEHWLLRVATGVVSQWFRTRQRVRLVSEAPEPVAPPLEAQADRRVVWRAALMRLDPDLQAVLVLHYVEDLSTEHVARVLGLRRGTVKSRLARARHELRRVLPASEVMP